MWSNIGYWYNNINSVSNMTPTTVKKSVKEGDMWKKSILDDFERIGLEQLHENLQFLDYYRMVDGNLSYKELSEVIPELSNIQDLLDGIGIPTFLKHYDLIGIIINVLVGNYMEFQNRFHIQDTGEVANNEYLREKNYQLRNLIKEKIDAEIELLLIKEGIDPKKQDFKSEEEKQAYIQQLQSLISEKTPAHIEKDLKKSFKTIGTMWGESTLERDKERFQLNKLERNEFKDFLLTGRCFRHHKLGYDYYKPETWSPINTFFSQTVDSEYVQNGEYVGRVHFKTPTEVIKDYGQFIKTTDQEKLIGGNQDWRSYVSNGGSVDINSAIKSNFQQSVIAPHANYFDYNFSLDIQEHFGVPMGTYKDLKTGASNDRWLSKRHGEERGYGYNTYANVLRDDLDIKQDVCQVTEVYFIAYDMIGYLSYENEETGEIINEVVTEDILPEFIKENNIKKIKTSKLVDINEEFEKNTLKWFYRPVCYEGVKVNSPNMEEPLYLYCRPCENQIKGDSNIYDIQLPVSGYIGKSLAKKISPWQTKYNLVLNQMYSLLEKELGTFFLMDVAFIPSEYKDWGDPEEAMLHLRNIAKEVGVMPIATTGDSQKNQTTFNQFATHNISYTNEINTRQQLAEFFKNKAYEMIGITPQQLGAANKYTNEEGIKTSQNASYAQIAEIYQNFSEYNQKTLELHLAVAQYAQADGKDITIAYTKGDSSLQFLKFNDPEFHLRRIGLIPSEDNKKRKELEQLKNTLLTNNTLGSDILELSEIIKSDSYSELLEIARIANNRKRQQEEEKYQRDSQLVERQGQLAEEKAQRDWEREEISKERDRVVRLEEERIGALGKAADKQSDTQSFSEINKQTDFALKSRELGYKEEQLANNLKLKEKQNSENNRFKLEELKLRAKELDERIKQRKSKEFTSMINKN